MDFPNTITSYVWPTRTFSLHCLSLILSGERILCMKCEVSKDFGESVTCNTNFCFSDPGISTRKLYWVILFLHKWKMTKLRPQDKKSIISLFSNKWKLLHWPFLKCNLLFSIPRRDLVVAAQNFFCAGCGTPVEPSKYGNWLTAYYMMTGQRITKLGTALIVWEKLVWELHNIALSFIKRPLWPTGLCEWLLRLIS